MCLLIYDGEGNHVISNFKVLMPGLPARSTRFHEVELRQSNFRKTNRNSRKTTEDEVVQ